MPGQSTPSQIATIGIDIGKNTFHFVGFDQRGAIVLQLMTSLQQLEQRLANLPRCLIGMGTCSGAHHIGRQPRLLVTTCGCSRPATFDFCNRIDSKRALNSVMGESTAALAHVRPVRAYYGVSPYIAFSWP